MNSKSQKLYSKMIAAALVTSAVVVPASVPAQAEEVKSTETVQPEVVKETVQANVISGSETQVNFYNTSKSDTSPTVDTTSADVVTVNNAVGDKKDTITVNGLQAKDEIKVYKDSGKKNLLATAKAKSNGQAVLKIKGGFNTKVVYVTLTQVDKKESVAKELNIPDEAQSDQVDTTSADVVTVKNAVGVKKDTITVNGLQAKDEIKVYADKDKKTLLGKAKAKKTGQAVLKIKGGFNTKLVYVTLTQVDKAESATKELNIPDEAQSRALDTTSADVVTVNNAAGTKKDTITVYGLQAKDEIKVYKDKDKKTLLATAKAKKTGEAIVKIKGGFVGSNFDSNGDSKVTSQDVVYVTLTEVDKLESEARALKLIEE